MQIFILASGSKGNMSYLKVGHIKLFVDAGISYKRIKAKMNDLNEDLHDVKTLLITHEHSDHLMGLKMLLKHGVIEDVYLTQGTFDALDDDVKLMISNVHIIRPMENITVLGLDVTAFLISHDAAEPVGFVIKYKDKKVSFINDTGYVDQTYYPILKNSDCYVLEANHHPALLMQSLRPFLLKKRIMGEKGHLSNEDACWLVNHLVDKDRKTKWIITHISEDCNTTLDIEEAIVKVFDDPTKVEVFYATREGHQVVEI